MSRPRSGRAAVRRVLPATALSVAVATAVVLAAPPGASAAPNAPRPPHKGHALGYDGGPARGGDDDGGSIADQAQEYARERSAPGSSPVSAAALLAARAQAAVLPARAGTWTEQTSSAYQAQPAGYTDPIWSNAGAGFDVVGGRVTALAQDGQALYAGAAGGGVWSSMNVGRTWAPLSDSQPSLSTGALTVNPADHALWVGTGEANTNADSYLGAGVYRLTTNGAGRASGSFTRVGGSELLDHQVYRLLVDGSAVFAATSQGLWRTSADGTQRWTEVLAPTATPGPYVNHITDVAVQPGTNGSHLIAVNGYRGGSTDNGIYASTDGGTTWTKVTPTGALDGTDVGRTTLAYAGDGRLYALMESPAYLAAGQDAKGSATNLKGFYVSPSGSPAGPWTQLADSEKLQGSGSAIGANSPGYQVGVQAWYNQALAVDPQDPNTVFVSLEEVFKTTDGGHSFTTASPYWDYGLSCGTSCPKTTHPDQHALLIDASHDVVIGNDGGVYSRPVSTTGYGSWSDLNASLHDLQYYDAKAGQAPGGQTFWGGLQDNGTSVVPSRGQAYEPAGGDGFDVIVDPANAARAVGEYTNLTAYKTSDGGHTFTTVSTSCVGQDTGYGATRSDCDPNARFQAPLTADPTDVNRWVAGGEYVWETTKGWATTCDPSSTCDWTQQYDLGAANAATAVADVHGTMYAAWVGGSGNPSPMFARGIATNAGGSWHQLDMSGLPNRYVAGVTVDPADPSHVYAVFNGYSRRWIAGAGNGVVFESRNGGASWTDLTGNLPDAPGEALTVHNGLLVLGTDVGVFAADVTAPTRWSRLGSGLPNAPVGNLTLAPNGTVVAATHGRGIWTLQP